MITRDVADCALLTRIISGQDERDATTAPREVPDYSKALGLPVKGLRVGIPAEYRSDKLNPEMQRLWDRFAAELKSLGAKIVEISLPHTKYSIPTYYIINPAEASSNFARYDGVKYGYRTAKPSKSLDEMYEQTRTEGFGPEVRKRLLIGSTILTEEFYERSYVKAMKVRRILANEFDEAFAKADVVLTPSTTGPAFSKNDRMTPLDIYLNDVYTGVANLTGLPAMSVPAGIDKDGLPLGLQLIGRRFDEETLFRFAYHIEKIASLDNRPSHVMGGAK
jgi:aspartyl-tRNA(Asn)/glutamyl-tRNA(Gln) amidotransferase subunit A